MAKEFKIVVDDGSVKVPIENKYGDEVGCFYFRPTDVSIVKRYNAAAEKFASVTEPLETVKLNPDGTADESLEGTVEAFDEAEKRLSDLMDYIFGGNMSEAFFGKMNPFSPVGGRFYCEIAMENLGKFITAQFSEETKKISKRVDQYTSKYIKGGKK